MRFVLILALPFIAALAGCASDPCNPSTYAEAIFNLSECKE